MKEKVRYVEPVITSDLARKIECKTSRRSRGRSLKYLKERFPQTEALQIDLTGNDDVLNKDNIRFLPAIKFLAQLV